MRHAADPPDEGSVISISALVRHQARCGGKTAKGCSVKSPAKQSAPDVLVANAGTVFTFCALTARAKEWIDENVQDDAQWFGSSLVVEHRTHGDWLGG